MTWEMHLESYFSIFARSEGEDYPATLKQDFLFSKMQNK